MTVVLAAMGWVACGGQEAPPEFPEVSSSDAPSPGVDTPTVQPYDSAPDADTGEPAPTETGTPPPTGGDTADTAQDTDTDGPIDTAPDCTPLTCTRRLEGEIAVVDGSPWATIYSDGHEDVLGIDVNPAGDVDGDGRADILTNSLKVTGVELQIPTGTWYLIVDTEPGMHTIEQAAVTLYFDKDAWDPAPGNMNQASISESGRSGGDLNGDGLFDILLFDTNYQDDLLDSTNTGVVFIVNGPVGEPGDRLNLAYGGATTTIGPDWSEFGQDAVGGEDLTGDGLPDVVALTIGHVTAGEDNGRVDIFAGPFPEGLQAQADLSSATILEGPDQFYSLAAGGVHVGDFTGDGVADVELAAANWDHNDVLGTGGLFVFAGPVVGERDFVDAEFHRYGVDYHDSLGWGHTGFQNDLDGDGLRDLVAGVDSDDDDDEGFVFVYAGGQEGEAPMEDATATLVGDEAQDLTLAAPRDGADLDGDGMGDLIVASVGIGPGDTTHGAYILYGPIPPGEALTSELADAIVTCGGEACIVAGSAGDVDGDGWEDLFMGAKWDNYGATDGGSVMILRGGLE